MIVNTYEKSRVLPFSHFTFMNGLGLNNAIDIIISSEKMHHRHFPGPCSCFECCGGNPADQGDVGSPVKTRP
jgi:hypothetical protein